MTFDFPYIRISQFSLNRNGEIYEGGWVYGSKQGHGVMKYNDGSLYEVTMLL